MRLGSNHVGGFSSRLEVFLPGWNFFFQAGTFCSRWEVFLPAGYFSLRFGVLSFVYLSFSVLEIA